jgi:hypothetical protein
MTLLSSSTVLSRYRILHLVIVIYSVLAPIPAPSAWPHMAQGFIRQRAAWRVCADERARPRLGLSGTKKAP